MTLKIQIEQRVHVAIDDVQEGRQVEDSFLELKSSWPSTDKMRDFARQLGGRCNAARHEPVVYVIGLDESNVYVDDSDSRPDMASWNGHLQSFFEGPAPELAHNFEIDYRDTKVFVLYFLTDRSPYVVKTGDDKYSFEVPWSEGTRTRSARRENLVSILTPFIDMPTLEVHKAVLSQPPTGLALTVFGFLYPLLEKPHTIASNKTTATFVYEDQEFEQVRPVVIPVSGALDVNNNIYATARTTMNFKLEFRNLDFSGSKKTGSVESIGLRIKIIIPELNNSAAVSNTVTLVRRPGNGQWEYKDS